VQPVWACNGAAIKRKSADQKRNCTDLFIIVNLAKSIYWNKKGLVNQIVVGPVGLSEVPDLELVLRTGPGEPCRKGTLPPCLSYCVVTVDITPVL
jgi:hypothetical protein